MPNVYVTAKTKYGDCRIRTTSRVWQEANPKIKSNHTPGMDSSRKHLSIKVKERLNKQGARIYFLHWDEISFGSISSQREPESPSQPPPSALAQHNARVSEMAKQAEAMAAEEDFEEATRLFPEAFGFNPPSSDPDVCGCTPRPITAM